MYTVSPARVERSQSFSLREWLSAPVSQNRIWLSEARTMATNARPGWLPPPTSRLIRSPLRSKAGVRIIPVGMPPWIRPGGTMLGLGKNS